MFLPLEIAIRLHKVLNVFAQSSKSSLMRLIYIWKLERHFCAGNGGQRIYFKFV